MPIRHDDQRCSSFSALTDMDIFQACVYLVSVVVAIVDADKKSMFKMASDHKIGSSVDASVPAVTARQCTMKCLASTSCNACNWHEATRTCELLGAHDTPVAAAGYTAFTRESEFRPISYI